MPQLLVWKRKVDHRPPPVIPVFGQQCKPLKKAHLVPPRSISTSHESQLVPSVIGGRSAVELDDTEHIHPGLRVRSYLGGDVPSLLQAQLSPVFACRLIALRPLEAAGPTTRIRMQNSRRAAFSACPRAPRRPMEWSVEGFLRLAIEEAASLPDRQRVSDRYWVALSKIGR